jgi:D-tyrosyl-tRNA(Tyr) deacylase
MRAVVQRVRWARVKVDGQVVGEIGPGLTVLLGAGKGDTERDVDYLAQKIVNLRIFEDDQPAANMNRSLLDVGGAMLVVSQFTLYGDCRKGRRPSFTRALTPADAEVLVDQFAQCLRGFGLEVATGQFGARMQVELTNHGPVTLVLEYP